MHPVGVSALSTKGLGKAFPGVRALDDFSLDVIPGEVHCLLGENGAGKSTLINILSGAFRSYDGEISVKGVTAKITSPSDAKRLGIGIIHQEMNLVPSMTVEENILLGLEPRRYGVFIDKRASAKRIQSVATQLPLPFATNVRVRLLSTAQQQMVEIAKALAVQSELLILDEPTASISQGEVEDLFGLIERLKRQGTSFIYVSHRLQELQQIGDRVTVMRDGRKVETLPIAEVSSPRTIELMVGRPVAQREHKPRTIPRDARVALQVDGLGLGQKVIGASFTLRKGEILGFAGLVGAGRTELMKLIFGAYPAERGAIALNGRPFEARSPKDAVRSGIGYLSEDRKLEGLVLKLSIKNNVTLSNLKSVANGVMIDRGRERTAAAAYVERLKIATPNIDKAAGQLSGGNQQKVVIAKWLQTNCDILIFDEPTRGIDVGARAEIHDLIVGLAEAGKSIIVVSSDLPEIMRLSDRVIVMASGRLSAQFVNDATLSQSALMTAMLAARHVS